MTAREALMTRVLSALAVAMLALARERWIRGAEGRRAAAKANAWVG
jgi:hypothetical protein